MTNGVESLPLKLQGQSAQRASFLWERARGAVDGGFRQAIGGDEPFEHAPTITEFVEVLRRAHEEGAAG